MSTDRTTSFSDNWGYLRAEFNWLDRVLRLAVARRQREKKAIDRIAKTPGERATSDWWKGLVMMDGTVGRDDMEKWDVFPSRSESGNYQQQLQEKIQASYRDRITLGLPMLCDRADLNLFEKQLVLASLAPEVNLRYSRMYQYLQDNDRTHLPTIDLILRLFCRGDREWRTARDRIISRSRLTQLGLVQFLPTNSETFLHRRVKLSDSLINYLLADRPDADILEKLLHPTRKRSPVVPCSPRDSTPPLVLPPNLQQSLAEIQHQWHSQHLLGPAWTIRKWVHRGQIVLFVGGSGTGKTTAAEVMAIQMKQKLTTVDLSLWSQPTAHLADLYDLDSAILLIKSAHLWCKRSQQTQIRQFLHHRQQHLSITIFHLHPAFHGTPVLRQWEREGIIDRILHFPIPDVGDRLKLWQQVFPPEIKVSPELDWETLAQRWVLTGGEIEQVAYHASILAARESADRAIAFSHIQQACDRLFPRKPKSRHSI
ncbi:hypothetical protein [Roseofilum casamattae]|uniref:Winged helix domain-containing protein n=1 Tax=Roseofilum casamattae BLCC-M143 TaxID=3022442 RepID=A0ABT7C2Z3_9CYAN|nr:hypothetical protein [Roseofilum casamattae]MDJ1185660.1 hypothetical protein [Roseofilum casamattae BLCC-M143]